MNGADTAHVGNLSNRQDRIERLTKFLGRELGIKPSETRLRSIVESAADNILVYLERPEEAFGVSRDAYRLDDIRRKANQLARSARELGFAAAEAVGVGALANGHRVVATTKGKDPSEAFAEVFEAIAKSASEARKKPPFKHATTARANMKAVAVAHALRKAWVEVLIERNPAEFEALVEKFENETDLPLRTSKEDIRTDAEWRARETMTKKVSLEVNHNRPGRFGELLESVFRELGVMGNKGEVATAVSALRRLAKLQDQFQPVTVHIW